MQIIVVAVVTTRWLKRSAAQIIRGRRANVGRNEESGPVVSLKIRRAKSSNSDARQAPSSFFRRDQGASLRSRQLRMRGVTMMIPVTSPCHHVHQFGRNAGQDTEPASARDSTA